MSNKNLLVFSTEVSDPHLREMLTIKSLDSDFLLQPHVIQIVQSMLKGHPDEVSIMNYLNTN